MLRRRGWEMGVRRERLWLVVEREEILREVWGENHLGDENLLGVYIRYLRKKLERPDLDPLIHTVRGVGFMLK